MKSNVFRAMRTAVFWFVNRVVERLGSPGLRRLPDRRRPEGSVKLSWAVGRAVYTAVYETVSGAVWRAVDGVACGDPPHPALADFLLIADGGAS